jgi:hypothetical protein
MQQQLYALMVLSFKQTHLKLFIPYLFNGSREASLLIRHKEKMKNDFFCEA